MNPLIFLSFLGSVLAGSDRLLVRLFYNGENTGQALWLSRSTHFPNLHTFQRFMQSYAENGPSNGGYNRPFNFDARVFRQDGELVLAWENIREGDFLYVVPDDTMFMWPGIEIGYKVNVSKTLYPNHNADIELETLSLYPRILRIRHLIAPEECSTLIELNMPNMTRSAVGKVDNYDQSKSPKTSRRTSTNNFDVSSPVSRKIIDRIFSILHITGRTAIEDGLQVVRYAQNEGYDIHTDFFPLGYSPELGVNFNPMEGGTNRYVTVFAYLTDDFQGGQTVFPHVPKPGSSKCEPPAFEETSWEETMTKGMCTHSLAVEPALGDAVIFYSSTVNGRMDPLTEHGGCPVTNGTKFGANLWVWNRGKFGSLTRYEVIFVNELNVPIMLYHYHAPSEPSLTLMARVSPGEKTVFLAHRGDEFVASTGTEWVGKFVVQDSHNKHQAFRIGWQKYSLADSFEYRVGAGLAPAPPQQGDTQPPQPQAEAQAEQPQAEKQQAEKESEQI